MRLSRRLAAVAAAAVTALPLLAGCANHPIGNTNNHITNGPPLPEVHPTSVAPAVSSAATPPSDSATASPSSSPSVSPTASQSASATG
ncbi:MAG: hypothetical protein JWM93_431 [Frankiales bacterium]|nr:hypothetical protein [Frankiales bacterium]